MWVKLGWRDGWVCVILTGCFDGEKMEWDPKKLRLLAKQRQFYQKDLTFSKVVDSFMRRKVYPRQKKLGELAAAWDELLPEELTEHSCLENFTRGTLKVLVDSPAHLAELNMLVREGLADHLREMCPNLPLSNIKIMHARWYHVDEQGNKIADF
ncbi:MAG: DUF721 domain-containing protein [Phycisphaerae bacterium]|nr:DUF721 domain-containing protein [Phycisphaerae bacterium]